jgi:hypothetical protein
MRRNRAQQEAQHLLSTAGDDNERQDIRVPFLGVYKPLPVLMEALQADFVSSYSWDRPTQQVVRQVRPHQADARLQARDV